MKLKMKSALPLGLLVATVHINLLRNLFLAELKCAIDVSLKFHNIEAVQLCKEGFPSTMV